MVKRHVYAYSSSTASSSSSDKSSSSIVSDMVSQGMLKCTWKHGLPSFIFSMDDLGEVYVVNILKTQSSNDKSMDYVYNFYSKYGRKREDDVQEIELDFVGMMEVSNLMILCPKNVETLETRFVFYGFDEQKTLAHNKASNKIKGLGNKVENGVKEGHGPKKVMAPTHELAAVVFKTHVEDAFKKQEIGGWGLMFLKKIANKRSDECSECSRSMNVLVPTGYHGGPRTRKLGDGGGGGRGEGCPSSIIERWSFGGHCDCGGWDVGCPLTIISTRPNSQENLPPLDDSDDDCKTIDLFVKGSKVNSPIMKMAKIQQDLYYINFHSTLSSLQCLSIATAIIHNRTKSLTPKLHSLD